MTYVALNFIMTIPIMSVQFILAFSSCIAHLKVLLSLCFNKPTVLETNTCFLFPADDGCDASLSLLGMFVFCSEFACSTFAL